MAPIVRFGDREIEQGITGWAGLLATLDAVFHLDNGHGFDHGTVSGNLGGRTE